MLKFSTYKTTGGLNHYAENKDFELEFIILRNPTGDWELREYQYGVFEEYKYFNKLAEAKAWANKNNDWLAECYPENDGTLKMSKRKHGV